MIYNATQKYRQTQQLQPVLWSLYQNSTVSWYQITQTHSFCSTGPPS